MFTAVCVVLAGVGHALASGAPVPWRPLVLGFLGLFALATPLAGRARSLPCIATALTVGQLGLHTLFGLGQQGSMTAGSLRGMGAMASMGPMDMMNPMGRSMPMGRPATDPAGVVALAGKLVCGEGAAGLSLSRAHSIVAAAGLDPAAGAVPAPRPTAASTMMLPSLPMALGHLLAALVTGWLLRRGEIALLRLTRMSHGVAEGALVRNLRAALALVRALRSGLVGAPAQPPRAGCAPLPTPHWRAGEALQHMVIRRGPPLVYVHTA